MPEADKSAKRFFSFLKCKKKKPYNLLLTPKKLLLIQINYYDTTSLRDDRTVALVIFGLAALALESKYQSLFYGILGSEIKKLA